MNKKQMKKLVSTLTIASILGTSIATPLNLMSTEAFASETRATSYDTSNLFKLTGLTDSNTDGTFRYANLGFYVTGTTTLALTRWSADSPWGKIGGDSERLGVVLGNDGAKNIGLSFHKAGVGAKEITARSPIYTKAGKKYYISYDILDSQSAETTEKAGDHKAVVRMKDLYSGANLNEKSHYFANAAGKRTEESGSFTFTAVATYTDLQFEYSTTRTTKDENNNQAWLTNVQIREDFSDQAQDMFDNLFTTSDHTTLKSGVTQADFDEVQDIINAVVVPENKTELQDGLDKAQSLLDAKNEAAAEQAKQTAAKQAVDALFNNDT
ncbi:toxin Cry1Ac domain D-VI-related protein, partial [Listeria grandensis]|uniref:toxin Cry1Ac domain D-VI-related protein n=1 Tax=Listeria grandensis TaxID=1494963 RepID=UPI00164D8466